MTASRFIEKIKGKNVAYITVKNRDYIRVSQIERLLKSNAASYSVYASEKGNPLTRALDLKKRIKKIDFFAVDVVIVGFLPQLVWKDVTENVHKQKRGIEGGEKSPDKKAPYLVADFFLSLYDTVVLDRKLIRTMNPMIGILRRMDKRVLLGANLVITDTKANEEFLAKEYDIQPDKFEVMYLEADPKFALEVKNGSQTASNKSPDIGKLMPGCDTDSFKVLYFGTGLPLQGTDIVMEAFVKASMEYENFERNQSVNTDTSRTENNNNKGSAAHIPLSLTYVGSTKHIPIRVKNSALVTKNINVIDWLPQEDLYKEIAMADLCLAGHFNPYIDKADRTIPGKAYIYEALEKKMLLGDTKANHELFTEDARHIFVRRGSAAALASGIMMIAAMTDRRN